MDGRTSNKLKEIAQIKNVDTNVIHKFYYMEQFVKRIAESKNKEHIILKGGFLIAHLSSDFFRTTSDIDATLKNISFNIEEIRKIFTEICTIDIGDGIKFELNNVELNQETKEYGGFKLSITYGHKLFIYFDVSCGEAIYPNIETKPINSFFEGTINILSYPIETIVAEKFESILSIGTINTRMKDYGDLYTIIKLYNLDIPQVKEAIILTSTTRNTLANLNIAESILQTKSTFEKINPYWPNYVLKEPSFSNVSFEEIILEITEFYKELKFE